MRSAQKGQYSTEPTHRPKAHQRYLEWTPSRVIAWGVRIGPATGAVIEALLARYPHPEQCNRTCLGLLSLTQRSDAARLEAACVRACAAQTISYRSVKSILATALDTIPHDAVTPSTRLPATQAHVRGAADDDHDTTVVDASLPLALTRTEAPC